MNMFSSIRELRVRRLVLIAGITFDTLLFGCLIRRRWWNQPAYIYISENPVPTESLLTRSRSLSTDHAEMKFFGTILLLAVASCHGDNNVKGIQRSGINSALEDLVEKGREMMKTGNEDHGIPVLDPFKYNKFDFDIENDSTNLKGTLTDVKVVGLSGYEASKLTFSVIGLKFTYCFNWPELELSSGYTVDGTVVDVVPLYGTGKIDVNVKGVNVCGNLALSVKNKYLYIRTSDVDFSIKDFAIKVTGLLNNEEASELLSTVIEDLVPQLLSDFSGQINTILSDTLVKLGNKLVGSMTLGELIALVTGK